MHGKGEGIATYQKRNDMVGKRILSKVGRPGRRSLESCSRLPDSPCRSDIINRLYDDRMMRNLQMCVIGTARHQPAAADVCDDGPEYDWSTTDI